MSGKLQKDIITANKNDMIICGIKDELYLCNLDIFKAVYELYDEKDWLK